LTMFIASSVVPKHGEVRSMGDFVRVARTDEIEPGQARLIDVKGTQIALFNSNGEFFARAHMTPGLWPRERSLATRSCALCTVRSSTSGRERSLVRQRMTMSPATASVCREPKSRSKSNDCRASPTDWRDLCSKRRIDRVPAGRRVAPGGRPLAHQSFRKHPRVVPSAP